MKCKLCKFPIYKGFEVFYQKEAYHPDCVVKVTKPSEKVASNGNGRKLKLVGEKK